MAPSIKRTSANVSRALTTQSATRSPASRPAQAKAKTYYKLVNKQWYFCNDNPFAEDCTKVSTKPPANAVIKKDEPKPKKGACGFWCSLGDALGL